MYYRYWKVNVLQLILVIFKISYAQNKIKFCGWQNHKNQICNFDCKMTKGDYVFCSRFVYYWISISDFIFYLYKIVFSFMFHWYVFCFFFFNFFYEFGELHKCQFKKIVICKKIISLHIYISKNENFEKNKFYSQFSVQM